MGFTGTQRNKPHFVYKQLGYFAYLHFILGKNPFPISEFTIDKSVGKASCNIEYPALTLDSILVGDPRCDYFD